MMGYISEKGDVIIKPKYDIAHPFSEDGIAIVGKKDKNSVIKYTAIETSGKELFSFSSKEYANFGEFKNGFLPVKKDNNEVILLTKNGKKAISVGKWVGNINEWPYLINGITIFKEGDAYGLKDENGKIVIRAKYDELLYDPTINQDYYIAKKQDKFGVIDKDDNIVLPFEYDELYFLNKTILAQADSKRFSFLNIDGRDIGESNFVSYSISRGTAIISNYFNAEKQALKLMENITEQSFFNTTKGQKLRDYSDYLTNVYIDMSTNILYRQFNSYGLEYFFDKTLASQRYEYIWWYSFPTGPEYNYNANLVACSATINLSQYQHGAEESFVNAMEKRLSKIGFSKSTDHNEYFVNGNTGTAIGFGYKDGYVEFRYVYNLNYMVNLSRDPRDEDITPHASCLEHIATKAECTDSTDVIAPIY